MVANFLTRLALWQQQLTGNRDTTAAHRSQYQPDASNFRENKRFSKHPGKTLLIWPAKTRLVGGWTNPFEKYARQNGFIFPK